jgi:hypothetical protein
MEQTKMEETNYETVSEVVLEELGITSEQF